MEYELTGTVAVAGLFAVIAIIVWQLMATWRTKIGVTREVVRERAYQELSQELAAIQNQTLVRLEKTGDDLSRLEARTDEITKLLKEVG